MTATAVKERPILFSGPMVRAILERRKTQTRRPINPQPGKYEAVGGWGLSWGPRCGGGSDWLAKWCPYGVPGDRLWVRETWREVEDQMGIPCIQYQADDALQVIGRSGDGTDHLCGPHKSDPFESDNPWKPSIHMFRWMSRIVLEITNVRVQRLQEINWSDAIDEGMKDPRRATVRTDPDNPRSPVRCFRELWDSLNKTRGFDWDWNPWVWALSFRRTNG